MAKHGGKRKGAGRKPKADELKLAEKMDNILDSDSVIQKLSDLALKGNIKAVELWMSYRYGRPQQSIDHTTNGNEVNLPPLNFLDAED